MYPYQLQELVTKYMTWNVFTFTAKDSQEQEGYARMNIQMEMSYV
jgi:hypothetical protein